MDKSLPIYITALLAFATPYFVIYAILVLNGSYANPAWGGEGVLSFWFVVASIGPGLLVTALFFARTHRLAIALVGATYMALQLPSILATRWISTATGLAGWGPVFTVYGFLLLFEAFVLHGIAATTQSKWQAESA